MSFWPSQPEGGGKPKHLGNGNGNIAPAENVTNIEEKPIVDPPDDLDIDGAPYRRRLVVQGGPVRPEFAHHQGVTVLCRLESYRSGTPRLSKRDMKLRFATWQVWEFCDRSYTRAAQALSDWRRRPVSRQHVYYVIRGMRDAGILDGIR